jgi:hypothetical protein
MYNELERTRKKAVNASLEVALSQNLPRVATEND